MVWRDSLVIGMNFVPDVVPEVLAKYSGLPGHVISSFPSLT